MSYQFMTYEKEGEVALIGLSRPEKRNAINYALSEELKDAALRAGSEARVGVIFGHGEHFCAGLDLADALSRVRNDGDEDLMLRDSPLDIVARGRIPFVVALHGAVVGMGLELAASAHIRIADETAFFGLPEAQRGIFVGAGGSVRIERMIGYARMCDLMLTGRLLNAREAEVANAAQYVVPQGGALEKAKAVALRICENAPRSNFAIINALPRMRDMSYEDGLFFEQYIARSTVKGPESAARLKAFLEKRAKPLT